METVAPETAAPSPANAQCVTDCSLYRALLPGASSGCLLRFPHRASYQPDLRARVPKNTGNISYIAFQGGRPDNLRFLLQSTVSLPWSLACGCCPCRTPPSCSLEDRLQAEGLRHLITLLHATFTPRALGENPAASHPPAVRHDPRLVGGLTFQDLSLPRRDTAAILGDPFAPATSPCSHLPRHRGPLRGLHGRVPPERPHALPCQPTPKHDSWKWSRNWIRVFSQRSFSVGLHTKEVRLLIGLASQRWH